MEFLRDRVQSGDRVIGTFIKTDSTQVVEVLAHAGLDFVVLDAEHAALDVGSLSRSVGTARLSGLPCLVRVPSHEPAFINACLDMGAQGILVPHVRSKDDVDAIADAVKYVRGRRGFSPSTRAGGYGTIPAVAYRASADASNAIWCQIEDRQAVDAIDDIAAHDALDCLFIGPADLSLSLGLDGPLDARLQPAIQRVIDAGQRYRRAVGMFVSSADQIEAVASAGVTVVLCGSDQSLLIDGAKRLAGRLSVRA